MIAYSAVVQGSALHADFKAGVMKGFSNFKKQPTSVGTGGGEINLHASGRLAGVVAALSVAILVRPIIVLIVITIKLVFPPALIAMPRFRISNPPATTPPSPAEVQKFSSKRESKSLIASSTAVALSIGSPPPDSRGTSSDNTSVGRSNTDWQTAYGAARMAVDVAKESSDMFLPLKAVVGAMSVLIKNYDVSALLRTEYPLILSPFSSPANGGQRRQGEGNRAEGAVAVRRACLSRT